MSIKKYIRNKLGIFMGVVALVGTILIGYKLFSNTNNRTKQVETTIKRVSSCQQRVVHGNDSYNTTYFDCLIDIEYVIDNKIYQYPNFNVKNNIYPLQVGGKLNVFYDPSNPIDISKDSSGHDKTSGIILFSFGVLYLFLTAWFLFKKYKKV